MTFLTLFLLDTDCFWQVIQPVVERSASVAAISAQHLVSRDYAMEADELKMQRAAHLMAKKLATGLALVTAKDVLRTTLVANFRNEFADPQWAEVSLPKAIGDYFLPFLVSFPRTISDLVD